jgi:hypothetical protein
MGTHIEVRIGSVVAAAGLIWAAKIATSNFTGIDAFAFARLPRGPLEICAIGILIWLHARWRRSVVLR